jgi:IclR family acetate operon transcriptional repressor
MRSTRRDAECNSVLGRALTILNAFDRSDVDGVRLTELAERSGIPKATTFRIVRTLVERRFLERDGSHYRPGIRLFELGGLVAQHRQLCDAATPFMGDLYEATHETIHLAVRDAYDVLYIEKIGGHRTVPVATAVGRRMPLHCTALGKVLLAGAPEEVVQATIARGLQPRTAATIVDGDELRQVLHDVRRIGIASEVEESAPTIQCAAAPIFGPDCQLVAALSVSTTTKRATRVTELAGAVRAAARGVSDALGAPPSARLRPRVNY